MDFVQRNRSKQIQYLCVRNVFFGVCVLLSCILLSSAQAAKKKEVSMFYIQFLYLNSEYSM